MATLDAVSPTCLKAVHEFDFEKTNPGLSGKFVLKHLLQRVSIALAMQSAVLAMIDSVCLTV